MAGKISHAGFRRAAVFPKNHSPYGFSCCFYLICLIYYFSLFIACERVSRKGPPFSTVPRAGERIATGFALG